MVQPLLVSTSAIDLAAETVRSILKIDDIVSLLVKLYESSNTDQVILTLPRSGVNLTLLSLLMHYFIIHYKCTC